MEEGWATVNFVHLGIHPHYNGGNSEGDVISSCIYEAGESISVAFIQGNGENAQYVGGFGDSNETSIKFAEDMESMTKSVNLTGNPDRVVVSVGGQIVADRDIYPPGDMEEDISISNISCLPGSTMALRIKNENGPVGAHPHFWRIVIYKVADDGSKEFYSDTYLAEFDFCGRDWTFSPKYSIANIAHGYVELRDVRSSVIAEKEFRF